MGLLDIGVSWRKKQKLEKQQILDRKKKFNPFTQKKLNASVEKQKNATHELFRETRDRIFNEESGAPQGMKFKGKPIHFDAIDGCWKFTETTNNYAFS